MRCILSGWRGDRQSTISMQREGQGSVNLTECTAPHVVLNKASPQPPFSPFFTWSKYSLPSIIHGNGRREDEEEESRRDGEREEKTDAVLKNK